MSITCNPISVPTEPPILAREHNLVRYVVGKADSYGNILGRFDDRSFAILSDAVYYQSANQDKTLFAFIVDEGSFETESCREPGWESDNETVLVAYCPWEYVADNDQFEWREDNDWERVCFVDAE